MNSTRKRVAALLQEADRLLKISGPESVRRHVLTAQRALGGKATVSESSAPVASAQPWTFAPNHGLLPPLSPGAARLAVESIDGMIAAEKLKAEQLEADRSKPAEPLISRPSNAGGNALLSD